jgi:hypothetical protein
MNRALSHVDGLQPASQGQQYQAHPLGAKKKIEPINSPIVDIYLRATVVGPVLEEILQSHHDHWEHWGLND